MAGREFGQYDAPPMRDEAGVNPFTTFVKNGMAPSNPAAGAKGGPALGNGGPMNMQALLPMLQLLMRGKGGQMDPTLIQAIMKLLGGKAI